MAFTSVGSIEGLFSGVTSSSDTISSVAVPNLGTDRVGVVIINVLSSPQTPTGVTWNGVAMSAATSAGTSTQRVYPFYLIGAAHNGNYNIVISYASSVLHVTQVTVAWVAGGSTITLDDTSTATGTTQNPAITSTQTNANEIVFSGSASSANGLVLPPTDCTALQDYDQGGNCSQSAYSIPTSSGDTTHTHNYDSSGTYAIASLSFKEASVNTSPTITLNTADAVSVGTTPTLEFTGDDAESDTLRYNVQITDNPDAWAGGEELEDDNPTGTANIHLSPAASATTPDGNPQIDDRPGQSFTGNGGKLTKIRLLCGDFRAATSGNAYVRVYTHAGTFGTSSAPAGAAVPGDTPTRNWLAISGAVAFTSGSTPGYFDFTFTGANQIRLTAGTRYVLIPDWVPVNTDNTNLFDVSVDSSSSAHPGNMYNDGNSVNNGVMTYDLKFQVYETYLLLDKVSGTDAGFVNTTDGGDTDPFDDNEKVSFTVQGGDALENVTYRWRARVVDPSGSAVYSSYSTARTFTVVTYSTGAANGLSTVTAVGSSLVTATGTADGIATAAATGSSLATASGTAAGVATASATAESEASTGTAAGSSTAAAVGASWAAASGTAAGVATASATSDVQASTGTAAGLATAAATGSSLADAAGTGAGSATAAAVGASWAAATGSAAGLATAAATGNAAADATGTAAGTATAAATGASWAAASGTAAGSSTASATASGTESLGTAAGSATVSAVGSSLVNASGTAAGTATATATGASLATASGTAAGLATASATGDAAKDAAGTAAGTSTASASSATESTGTAAGSSTAAAIGASYADAVGLAAGTSTGFAVGQAGGLLIPDAIVVSFVTFVSPQVIQAAWAASAVNSETWIPAQTVGATWVATV